MVRTLIICPTFNHADTLIASIASVQVQTDPDWELVVIGDGAPPRTKDIVETFASRDPRIRYEGHEKGPRMGEVYRDAVVRESDATFLCHLGDDDLWSDRHLETMLAMLEDADWAMQGTLQQMPNGTHRYRFANHSHPLIRAQAHAPYRPMLDGGINNVALRRSAYNRPGLGWETSVPGLGSDQFMWGKYLRDPGIRVAASAAVTSLKLRTAREREGASPLERLAEMAPLLATINAQGALAAMRARAAIVEPLFRVFYLTGAGHAPDFEMGCEAAGMRPVAVSEMPTTGVAGSTMDVPLTLAQLETCRWTWCLAQAAVTGNLDVSSVAMTFSAHRFFVLVSLRELAGFDATRARTLALELGKALDEAKFAENALSKIDQTVADLGATVRSNTPCQPS